MKRYLVAMLAVAALTGCAGKNPAQPTEISGVWSTYPKAFIVRDEWQSGPVSLVADGGCFVGVGQDSTGTGMVAAAWVATGDCTQIMTESPRSTSGGDSLPSQHRTTLLAAVPTGDGEFLAIGRTTFYGDAYAYSSFAVRGRPGSWRSVARFESASPKSDHVGPATIVARPGGGYVAAGRRGNAAVVWASNDGNSWTESALQAPPGTSYPTVSSAAAAPDGTLVIAGSAGTGTSAYHSVAAVWVSTDRGTTWRSATMPSAAYGERVTVVVHDGKRFLALGGKGMQGREDAALALVSSDGITWQREPRLAPAGAHGYLAAAVSPNGLVFASAFNGEYQGGKKVPAADKACASVWLLAETEVTEEKLTCLGVPTSLAVLRDGRVAAVHWSTLRLRSAQPQPESKSSNVES